jgi:membrane fusion protein (multidrug efflux system)
MQKGEMTGPGSPIISVVDISSVKITAGIPERYMGKVSKGDRVKITFDVFPDEEFDGIINFVSPVLNAQNRTFEIEVKMNNKSGKLKPEMSANVYITVRNIDNAIVLEQDLIVDNGEEKFVFILEGDLAKKRIVKLDGRSDNKVNVEEGLNDGDNLIYIGFQSLTDGDKVKVLN